MNTERKSETSITRFLRRMNIAQVEASQIHNATQDIAVSSASAISARIDEHRKELSITIVPPVSMRNATQDRNTEPSQRRS